MEQGITHFPLITVPLSNDPYGYQLLIDLSKDEYRICIRGEVVEVNQFGTPHVDFDHVMVPVCRSDSDQSYLRLSLQAFKRLLDQVPVSYFHPFVYDSELHELQEVMRYDDFRSR